MPPEQRQSQTGSSSSSAANVVGVHFKIGRKIGEGSFGVIYQGKSKKKKREKKTTWGSTQSGTNLLNNQPVAVKFEPRKTDAPQLRDEYRAYKILAGSPGVPYAHYYGQEGLHNVLVIDLLGSSLEDLFDTCSRQFTVKTVAMLAKEMVTRLECVHEHHLVYRDIKPDNFLVGRGGKNNQVYLIDFGMAKHYRDPKTKQHIPYRERKSLSGTARYMSINTHLGREQSRRDDLESLGHVFMYFLRGSLPWQGLKAATNKQKYERIGDKKQSTSIKDLCAGYPGEFAIYLQYVRKLGFEETPDYDFLRDLFNKVLKAEGGDDGVYDWMMLDRGKERSSVASSRHHSSTHFDGGLKNQTPSAAPQLQKQHETHYQSMVINSNTSPRKHTKRWKRFWHNVGRLVTCGDCRGCQVKGWCCTCHCECGP